MAAEIIKKTENFILVQIDERSTERVIYQDAYRGGFNSTEEIMMAQRYDDQEKAKKVAEALNTLYEITGKNFTVKVAKETISRELVDGLEDKESKEDEAATGEDTEVI